MIAQVGSKVRVTDDSIASVCVGGSEAFYKLGDIAVLKKQDSDGDWWCDFKGNPTGFFAHGYWCMRSTRFEVIA
jgi:hypothetical protein